MIESFVAERYGAPPDQERAEALYDQLLESLWFVVKGGVLPVFTTNYDLAVERYWFARQDNYDLRLGFEKANTNEWDASTLHAVSVPPSRKLLVLMKLHGSTQWEYLPDLQTTINHPLGVRPQPAQHALVAPVREKAPDREPFLTYFAYLEECAANAAGLVVLGYAFNERGVRNAIRMGLARRRGRPLHVLVVDTCPSGRVESLKEVALPGSVVPEEVKHDFERDQPSQLCPPLERWAAGLADRFAISPRSSLWVPSSGMPSAAVSRSDDEWTIVWCDAAASSGPHYWEWPLPSDAREFTVSFEMCPQRVGRGGYPGVQLAGPGGEQNILSLVVAAGRTTVNSTSDDDALATVLGSSGWAEVSGWGTAIRGDGWIPAALQVRGREWQAVVGDRRTDGWCALNGDGKPACLRVGIFGQGGDQAVSPGRCLVRELRLSKSVDDSGRGPSATA